jgi:Peptidase S24-like
MNESVSPEAVAAVLRKRVAKGPVWLDVSGSSMGSAIPSGARVLVQGRATPRRGEVWAFCTAGGNVVVHRFRRNRGGQLWFQGDANAWVDVPIDASLLIGRVNTIDVDGRRRRLGAAATTRARLALDLRAIRRAARAATARRPGRRHH